MAVRKQNEIAVSIPFDKIKRIQIYENPKGKSLATIMKETGADYAINGTLYNMRTRNAVCPLSIDGVTKFAGLINILATHGILTSLCHSEQCWCLIMTGITGLHVLGFSETEP